MSSDVPKGHVVPETCGHTYVKYVPTTVKNFFATLRSGRNHSRQISVEESALNNRSSPENVCSGEPKGFLSKELERLENISLGSAMLQECEHKITLGALVLLSVSQLETPCPGAWGP